MIRLLVSICLRMSLLSVLLIAGCMLGPDYSRPQTAADTNDGYFNAGMHYQDVNDFGDAEMWWQRFGDPTTAQLVRQMLENNYDLKAAAARVLQAQAALAEVHGGRLPDVSYSLGRDRSKVSFNLGALGGGRFSFINETWTQNISVAYVVDLFGKLKRAERAAWAQMLAAEANEQALVNSMIATVVQARVNIAILQKRLAIANANSKSLEETVQIVERRYNQGLVGPVDVRLARENLEAAKALEPSIELSLIKARHALDVILGSRPGSSDRLPQMPSDLPVLGPVPIGLPASLLDRRPDVIAAEFNLRAANEQIGVSIAQLYPDLVLTATYGASADRWRDIWEHFSETYSAMFGLSQPIFQGGRLRAQVDASKARYEELAANYSGTVLTAMREVEDTLVTEKMLQKELEHTELRFQEAQAAENLSKERYKRGVESILSVLASEQQRRISEEQIIVLKGQMWTTRVNLHLALGGDWDPQSQTEKQKDG